jgi:hypothetical protein
MLHPIHEIGQFMNCADSMLRLRLGCWPLHIFAQFMNWAEKIAQFVKWAREIWPVHEMGNFTNGV